MNPSLSEEKKVIRLKLIEALAKFSNEQFFPIPLAKEDHGFFFFHFKWIIFFFFFHFFKKNLN